MENATKALLIAGAVLVTILIISSAILLVTKAQETFNSSKSTITGMQVTAFNSQFEFYEGQNITGEQVISLLKTVQTSNNENKNKVVIKLSNMPGIPGMKYDTARFVIVNENGQTVMCSSGTPVSISKVINSVKPYRYSSYAVDLWYCNKKTAKYNSDLSPVVGAVFYIHIRKNDNY